MELKFEIIKRKNNQIKVYSIFISIMIFLGLVLLIGAMSHDADIHKLIEKSQIFIIVALIVLGFFTFKILPNILSTKYLHLGFIEFLDDKIVISKGSKMEEYKINSLFDLSIIINGYDGQPVTGAPQPLIVFNKPTNSGLPCVDGNRNYITFSQNGLHYRFEFYINKIDFYESLLTLVKNWKNRMNFKYEIMR